MATIARDDYNQRLFSGNWRSRLHLSRFYWVAAQVRKLNLKSPSMIELGCYDGKTLEFLDSLPARYLGLDANWEGGLDEGRAKWHGFQEVEFRFCQRPEDIPVPQELFDLGICMETLEHVPPDLVDPYLLKLSQVVKSYLFITVPVERGIAFLVKHGLKKVLAMHDDPFQNGEFFNSMIGRLDKVGRREHKGFDDRLLVKQVGQYFDVISVTGVFPHLPLLSANLTIGIIAKRKP